MEVKPRHIIGATLLYIFIGGIAGSYYKTDCIAEGAVRYQNLPANSREFEERWNRTSCNTTSRFVPLIWPFYIPFHLGEEVYFFLRKKGK